ncbi:MAG: hypothetical protein ABGZ36_00825 [Actinomycetota bacterium]
MAAQQHTSTARRVAVFGQGYVGLSVACAAATAGYAGVRVDSDAERIAALWRAGTSLICSARAP